MMLERKPNTMNVIEKATANQLKNIEAKTEKSLDELLKMILASRFSKHGEIRDFLKTNLALGHGDANVLAHMALKAETGPQAASPEDEIYSGPKADLRPVHDKLMAAVKGFGAFEVAPKKGYLSLRRKKQFAMVGPATRTQIEVGLNLKGQAPTDRLIAIPPGGMCQFKVRISSMKEVDAELLSWVRLAYDAAA